MTTSMTTPPDPDYARVVRTTVEAMPMVRHLGIVIARLEPGACELELPARPELTGHGDIVAGSILGALADVTAGCAAGTLLPPGWASMTVDFTVKLVAPARGPSVLGRGRVVAPGTSTTIAAADLYARAADGDERLCATALVTMRNLRRDPGAAAVDVAASRPGDGEPPDPI